MDGEDLRLIRQMVRQEMTPILMGTVIANEDANYLDVQRLSNEQVIEELRRIQPYGLASKAPPGTSCLAIPIAGDSSNIAITGDFDTNRPEVQDGEAALYGPKGQMILMKADGSIHQGSGMASSPAVLGDILAQFCDALINAFLNAAQVGQCAVGPVMLDPSVRLALMTAKQTFVDTALTNFLSNKTFVEKGSA